MDNPPDDDPCEILITAPNREWLKDFGRTLVTNKLAAAAHVDNMETVYRWKDAVKSGEEARLVLHTTQARVGDITRRVQAEHEFETPSLIVRPIIGGSRKYLKWIEDETTRDRNSPTPLSERVAKWLNLSGFPLEMRVAQEVRALEPTSVTQESKYVDPITGAIRPVDVEAIWAEAVLPDEPDDSIYHAVTLAIECKSGPHPWVLLKDMDDTHEMRIVSSLYTLPKRYSAALGHNWEIAFETGLYAESLPILEGDFMLCYAMQQMKGNRQDEDGKNEAHDALRQTASGALGLLGRLDADSLPAENNFVIPILVTTHPLFVASLSADGEVEVEHTDRGAVVVRIAGGEETDSHVLVHVVSETALPTFLQKCTDLVDVLLTYRPNDH